MATTDEADADFYLWGTSTLAARKRFLTAGGFPGCVRTIGASKITAPAWSQHFDSRIVEMFGMDLLDYAQFRSESVESLRAGDAIIVEKILNVLEWINEEDITFDHKAIIAGTFAVSPGIGFADGSRRCLVLPFPDSSYFKLL